VLSCNGINVDVNEAEMRNIVQEVEKLERKPEFGKALDKLLTIWNGAGNIMYLIVYYMCHLVYCYFIIFYMSENMTRFAIFCAK
jgi:hypothetical protein